MKTPQALITTGKRKAAMARASFTKGIGRVHVNRLPLEIYEPVFAREKIAEPLLMIGDRWKGVDIDVTLSGGGIAGQAAAARTAIARGLISWLKDEQLRETFKHYDRSLVVNDPRRKLPKRPGGRGARARRQKSYR
ncbi:MAG: 30S ribosomal protein S9 [Thermoplasmata archaeon]